MSAKGSRLQVKKVHNDNPGNYSETIEYTLLHCNNFTGNNNKFYIIEIQKNSGNDCLQLFSNYGRLGGGSVYEIRKCWKENSDPVSFDEIKDEYDAIIKKKFRGKSKKNKDGITVRETYSIVDVISPNVGSTNIKNKTTVIKETNIQVTTKSKNSEVSRILTQLAQENIHDILSKTSLKFSKAGGLETELGPVTSGHIDNAKLLLNDLNPLIKRLNDLSQDENNDLILTNNKYYSLIPRSFGQRISDDDLIKSPDKLKEEYELLDGLRAAIKLGTFQNIDNSENKLEVGLLIMKSTIKKYKEIVNYFENSRNHNQLNAWKIKNIFTVSESKIRKDAFDKLSKKIGNVDELFHGSRSTNILSILVNGLIIPPSSAGHCTGRMFGDGIYSSNCSTKALNYATGYWDGSSGHRNAFMFITKFAMGNVQYCKTFNYGGAKPPYDSVIGLTKKDGGSLMNNEQIVYNIDQVSITHLIELEK